MGDPGKDINFTNMFRVRDDCSIKHTNHTCSCSCSSPARTQTASRRNPGAVPSARGTEAGVAEACLASALARRERARAWPRRRTWWGLTAGGVLDVWVCLRLVPCSCKEKNKPVNFLLGTLEIISESFSHRFNNLKIE